MLSPKLAFAASEVWELLESFFGATHYVLQWSEGFGMSLRNDIDNDGTTGSAKLRLTRVANGQSSQTSVASGMHDVGRRGRIEFLDVAKGIGILLVVMGHCLGGLHDAGLLTKTSIGWLPFYFIYCFHMPLFFFLTGSLVEARVRTKPLSFLQSSVTRIAYPYFLWGAIQTTALLLAANLINHPVQVSTGTAVVRLLWAPPAQFWFLYVLFILHSTALLTISLGGRVLFAFTFAALYAVCAGSPAAFDAISHFVSGGSILFYVIGVCFGGSIINWRGRFEQPYAWVLLSVVLFCSAAWQGWTWGEGWYSYATLPAAFAGSAAVLLVARSDELSNNQLLAFLGRSSMSIYVLHVLFVAGTRIVLDKFFHLSNLAIIVPAIFTAGVAGPLLVNRAARILRVQHILGLG